MSGSTIQCHIWMDVICSHESFKVATYISFDYTFKICKQQTKALQYSLMWHHVGSCLGSNVYKELATSVVSVVHA
jgi:hypothetical protein